MFVFRGRNDTFGATLSMNEAVQVSEGVDSANFASIAQWCILCNVEDDGIEDQNKICARIRCQYQPDLCKGDYILSSVGVSRSGSIYPGGCICRSDIGTCLDNK